MRSVFAIALLIVLAAPPVEAVTRVGIGGFGGVSVPVVQDDVETGSQFGVRLPVSLVSMLTLEPYFASSSMGDVSDEFTGGPSRDGFKVTAFGVNAALGQIFGSTGVKFFPYAGIGSHKLTRDGSDDIKETGYNFGFGLAISPASMLTLSARAELNMVVTGDTSRKFGNGTVGLTYALYPRK